MWSRQIYRSLKGERHGDDLFTRSESDITVSTSLVSISVFWFLETLFSYSNFVYLHWLVPPALPTFQNFTLEYMMLFSFRFIATSDYSIKGQILWVRDGYYVFGVSTWIRFEQKLEGYLWLGIFTLWCASLAKSPLIFGNLSPIKRMDVSSVYTRGLNMRRQIRCTLDVCLCTMQKIEKVQSYKFILTLIGVVVYGFLTVNWLKGIPVDYGNLTNASVQVFMILKQRLEWIFGPPASYMQDNHHC